MSDFSIFETGLKYGKPTPASPTYVGFQGEVNVGEKESHEINNKDILRIACLKKMQEKKAPIECKLKKDINEFLSLKRQQERAKKTALINYNQGKISSDELMLTLIGGVT